MNIIDKLTLKHIQLNKKRTIVTIIGVIISVAMITAVPTCILSFMAYFQNMEIENHGKWHLSYSYIDYKSASDITTRDEVQDSTVYSSVGFAQLDNCKNIDKPYLYILAFSSSTYDIYPINLIEGSLPTNDGEIVIPEHLKSNGGISYNVGDTITIDVGTRVTSHSGDEVSLLYSNNSYLTDDESLTNCTENTYKIVGIIKRPSFETYSSPGYTCITYLDESTLTDDSIVSTSIFLKDVTSNIYTQAYDFLRDVGYDIPLGASTAVYDDSIYEHMGNTSLSLNSSLLIYYGISTYEQALITIYSTGFIVILIIMIGSISLIYNAFAISISERSRHLGMLTSVGATKSQKRRSAYFEGALISIISIPLGLLSGISGIWLTFKLIRPLLASLGDTEVILYVVVSWQSIVIAIVFSILTIAISVLIPAKRASRITAIDAIRQTQDVKLKTSNVKTSKLTSILLGFEAEIALKNLKRNRKRYKATIFSLSISIILFLVVSSYVNMLRDSYTSTTSEQEPYDIQISSNALEVLNMTDDYNNILLEENNDIITKIYSNKIYSPNVLIDPNLVSSDINENYYYYYDEHENVELLLNIVSLDDDQYRNYLETLSLPSSYNKPILYNMTKIISSDKKYDMVKSFNVSENSTIPISFIYYMSEETSADNNELAIYVPYALDIGCITDKLPPSMSAPICNLTMVLIVNDKMLYNIYTDIDSCLNGHNYDYISASTYISTTDDTALEKSIEELSQSFNFSEYNYNQTDLYVFNQSANSRNSMNLMTAISVFVYGFIVLISLICVANIFNTMSTSISLRKREFAMLRSVGMTPHGFNKMIIYESAFYGLKALLYGLPISFILIFILYKILDSSFYVTTIIPINSLIIVVVAISLIVSLTMWYSVSKFKKENIVASLKNENI